MSNGDDGLLKYHTAIWTGFVLYFEIGNFWQNIIIVSSIKFGICTSGEGDKEVKAKETEILFYCDVILIYQRNL
jgi:hypothetical protein